MPYDFPQIEKDLDVLVTSMAKLPSLQNKDMLLSFVRDHSMNSDWVSANPVLAEMISTNTLPVKNLETLFASCRQNLPFRLQLEEYIAQRFKTSLTS